jgi:hypothetical protein
MYVAKEESACLASMARFRWWLSEINIHGVCEVLCCRYPLGLYPRCATSGSSVCILPFGRASKHALDWLQVPRTGSMYKEWKYLWCGPGLLFIWGDFLQVLGAKTYAHYRKSCFILQLVVRVLRYTSGIGYADERMQYLSKISTAEADLSRWTTGIHCRPQSDHCPRIWHAERPHWRTVVA